tara:strand:+ start:1388 stop:2227 length:840 start_codon:yes stop_codon:yes gene_type:complete
MFFSGHRPRKSFGQHWLINETVLDEIINAANINSEDRILEIGPGKGVLTEKLLKSEAAFIHAIEIDRNLVVGLRKKFKGFSNFNLIEGDALSIPFNLNNRLLANKALANIPYNITSPLLEKFLGRLAKPLTQSFSILVLLMQKEVADRILSLPGKSSYSALTVRTQLLAKCTEICTVNPDSFHPIPKVYSKVIMLKPYIREERLPVSIESKIDSLLNVAFRGRRKMIKNTLPSICSLDILEKTSRKIGITLNQRPQEISPDNWISLAKAIKLEENLIEI